MHKNILTHEQLQVLFLIKKFSSDFYLAGGTAIALYIGHRRSIDFDLFSYQNIKRKHIKKIIEKNHFQISDLIYEAYDQLHIVLNNVKLTFFNFPYKIEHNETFEDIITMPSLIDLAALKAHALGGRAKWKDYVDLYFLLKNYYSLKEISDKAEDIFGEFFNKKLFREQLAYFKDIDYKEEVEFINMKIEEKKIKDYLTQISLSPF